jgi:hypothetical protein
MTVRFVPFRARTINTPMHTARAAILRQRFAQMLSRPVQPHRQIIPRHTHLRRNLTRIVPLQIHSF